MSICVSEIKPVLALGCLVSKLYEKNVSCNMCPGHLVLNVPLWQLRNTGNMLMLLQNCDLTRDWFT